MKTSNLKAQDFGIDLRIKTIEICVGGNDAFL